MTDAIISDPKATVVVGVRRGIQVHCDACETYHGIKDECACPSILSPISLEDFYGDQPMVSEDVGDDLPEEIHSYDQPYDASITHDIILNSVRLSIWGRFANGMRKKLNCLVRSFLIWGHPLLQNSLIPRGP